MTAAGEIILIRQERIPVRSTIWEVPAGQIDDANDSAIREIEKVALRELREETGYQLTADGELLSLGIYFSSPGFTDEKAHLFLARRLEMSAEGNKHSESESIVDCRNFTPREVACMITNGEIRDGNTLAICARLIASGLLSFYG
ncbi:MAG: NUDIX hydrolase [Verrucomicrobiota bacterium]|nr:NUDIX hydrolase [Verrucomicrobiota bacterium]